MNRILLDHRAPGYALPAGDPRFDHARGVLRLQIGDLFDIGVIDGPVGKGRVTAIGDTQLHFAAEWGEPPPPLPPVTLLIGLARPQTMKRVLHEATTLGVARIVVCATGRSDPAYSRSQLWTEGGWHGLLVQGAEQAFCTRLPQVDIVADLAAAVAILATGDRRLALDPYESVGPLAAGVAGAASVTLAIGPERGWNANDRRMLRAAGFTLVGVGSRILRVETATVAALAVVHALRGTP
jgi:16S rRNA (uracil1498-N3)-methyltransferase